jgi:hypothetical protein
LLSLPVEERERERESQVHANLFLQALPLMSSPVLKFHDRLPMTCHFSYRSNVITATMNITEYNWYTQHCHNRQECAITLISKISLQCMK